MKLAGLSNVSRDVANGGISIILGCPRDGFGDAARIPELAKELVALQPDLIVANTTPVTRTLHRETKEPAL